MSATPTPTADEWAKPYDGPALVGAYASYPGWKVSATSATEQYTRTTFDHPAYCSVYSYRGYAEWRFKAHKGAPSAEERAAAFYVMHRGRGVEAPRQWSQGTAWVVRVNGGTGTFDAPGRLRFV